MLLAYQVQFITKENNAGGGAKAPQLVAIYQ